MYIIYIYTYIHTLYTCTYSIMYLIPLQLPLSPSVGCGACFMVLRKVQRIKHRGLFRQAPNSKVPLPSDAATHVQIQTLLQCLESMDLRCRLFTLSPLSC